MSDDKLKTVATKIVAVINETENDYDAIESVEKIISNMIPNIPELTTEKTDS